MGNGARHPACQPTCQQPGHQRNRDEQQASRDERARSVLIQARLGCADADRPPLLQWHENAQPVRIGLFQRENVPARDRAPRGQPIAVRNRVQGLNGLVARGKNGSVVVVDHHVAVGVISRVAEYLAELRQIQRSLKHAGKRPLFVLQGDRQGHDDIVTQPPPAEHLGDMHVGALPGSDEVGAICNVEALLGDGLPGGRQGWRGCDNRTGRIGDGHG